MRSLCLFKTDIIGAMINHGLHCLGHGGHPLVVLIVGLPAPFHLIRNRYGAGCDRSNLTGVDDKFISKKPFLFIYLYIYFNLLNCMKIKQGCSIWTTALLNDVSGQ
ncbi:hypothetical protein G0027_08550 [Acinetobacter indicus]|uniref:Uncharacterized protein n=1 Tax=Acinetobacter indicus TaxID=756892 RepID=A0A7S6VQP8_9GAMM|nr:MULTISPECIES: hypothetical protein [Acinetobacter]QOW42902.1 hypothetical protein G0027_08550 [Acinetobacter indicus]